MNSLNDAGLAFPASTTVASVIRRFPNVSRDAAKATVPLLEVEDALARALALNT
jgi:hypothetical protein